jgi:hypothetical protein
MQGSARLITCCTSNARRNTAQLELLLTVISSAIQISAQVVLVPKFRPTRLRELFYRQPPSSKKKGFRPSDMHTRDWEVLMSAYKAPLS